MLLWKSLAPLRAVISNGFFSLKSRTYAFDVHLKNTRLRNVMHSKKEKKGPFQRMFKTTMRDSSLWAISNHHQYQDLEDLLPQDLTLTLTPILVIKVIKITTTTLITQKETQLTTM